ncbi:unnamed protein product, partial [Didymodactylos carnosus]
FVLSYTLGIVMSNIKQQNAEIKSSKNNNDQNIILYLNPLSDINLVWDEIDTKLIINSVQLKLQDDNINEFSSELSDDAVCEFSDCFELELEKSLEWNNDNYDGDLDDIWISNEKTRRKGSDWSLYNMA